jgi:acyl-CoA synthetase (NDP forming)
LPRSRAILASYRIAGPKEKCVTSADDVVKAAESIGFPVVLKGVVPGMLHKTEAGLVKLRLADAQAVRDAAVDMNAPAISCSRWSRRSPSCSSARASILISGLSSSSAQAG